jgi:quercetin dioxygenase-like cupin family protein
MHKRSSENGNQEEIHPGDVVWISPGEKHWHGAAPTTAMTHYGLMASIKYSDTAET